MSLVFLNLGYLLMLVALIVRDILWLRAILACGQVALVVACLMLDNPNAAMWQGLFSLINLVWVIKIARERKPIEVPGDLQDLYKEIFAAMTRREFLYFWQMGRLDASTNSLLIREGEKQEKLMIILDGRVEVRRESKTLARLGRGSFIAEMSFLTGDAASADVVADGTVRTMSWEQEKLRNLRLLNPQLFIKLQSIIGHDLTRKIKAGSRSR